MKKITFIGAGQMAEAIISGVLNKGLFKPEAIYATNKGNPNQLAYLTTTYDINTSEKITDVLEESDVIVIAVKPKDKTEAITSIDPYIKEEAIVISVMAGVETATIESLLTNPMKVIRVMPNTSAKVGLSATGLSRGTFADDEAVRIATSIFEAIGSVVEVQEQDLHAVTAVSGSGPAYFYYMVEAMLEEGVALGLSEETTKDLVTETIKGAAKMLDTSDLSPAVLRKNITSPNGTTERAILTFDQCEMKTAIKKGVRGAHRRSVELSQEDE